MTDDLQPNKVRKIDDFSEFNLKVVGTYVKPDFSKFAFFIQDMFNQTANRKLHRLDSMKFISNRPIADDEVLNSADVAKAGMSPLDYYLYKKLRFDGYKANLIIDENLKPRNIDYDYKVLLFCYFMLMTRAKINTNEKEEMPKFAQTVFGLKDKKWNGIWENLTLQKVKIQRRTRKMMKI